MGVGVAGVMRAFASGAPVRILAPAFTGTGDLYWYVKADSPLKSIKDMTAAQTLAYSTNGSSSHNIVTAFVEELGVKGKATATGSPAGTLTSVMSGQIDVGWAAPPFGLQEVKDGKIRILARGSDVPSLKDQTVRVTIVNAGALKARKDVMTNFIAGYRESVDYMYADPAAIDAYAKKLNASAALIKESVAEFHPKAALQSDTMKDLDGAVKDAVKLKYLREPLTKEQLAELLQIPPRAAGSN
jgi:NitT/TauT family transport system substrate-binding protein